MAPLFTPDNYQPLVLALPDESPHTLIAVDVAVLPLAVKMGLEEGIFDDHCLCLWSSLTQQYEVLEREETDPPRPSVVVFSRGEAIDIPEQWSLFQYEGIVDVDEIGGIITVDDAHLSRFLESLPKPTDEKEEPTFISEPDGDQPDDDDSPAVIHVSLGPVSRRFAPRCVVLPQKKIQEEAGTSIADNQAVPHPSNSQASMLSPQNEIQKEADTSIADNQAAPHASNSQASMRRPRRQTAHPLHQWGDWGEIGYKKKKSRNGST